MSNLQEWAEYLFETDEQYRIKLALLRKDGSAVGPAKNDHVNRMVVALIKRRALKVTRERLAFRDKRSIVEKMNSELPTARDVPDFDADDFQAKGDQRGLWNQPYESHLVLDGHLHAYHLCGPQLSRQPFEAIFGDRLKRLTRRPTRRGGRVVWEGLSMRIGDWGYFLAQPEN